MKGQIPDKDFSLELIVQMAKIYFRTIHKKAMTFIDDEAMDKAAKRAVATRRRGRRAAVSQITLIVTASDLDGLWSS